MAQYSMGLPKQFFCICLLVVHICTATEVYQLYKLPAFFTHLQDHRQQNANITLFDYLTLHYAGNPTDTDNDAADDNRLPFKQHELPGLSNWSLVPLPSFCSLHIPVPNLQNRKLWQYEQPFLPSGYTHRVWQPPKAA